MGFKKRTKSIESYFFNKKLRTKRILESQNPQKISGSKFLQVLIKKAYYVIKYSTKHGKMNMNNSILARLFNTILFNTIMINITNTKF